MIQYVYLDISGTKYRFVDRNRDGKLNADELPRSLGTPPEGLVVGPDVNPAKLDTILKVEGLEIEGASGATYRVYSGTIRLWDTSIRDDWVLYGLTKDGAEKLQTEMNKYRIDQKGSSEDMDKYFTGNPDLKDLYAIYKRNTTPVFNIAGSGSSKTLSLAEFVQLRKIELFKYVFDQIKGRAETDPEKIAVTKAMAGVNTSLYGEMLQSMQAIGDMSKGDAQRLAAKNNELVKAILNMLDTSGGYTQEKLLFRMSINQLFTSLFSNYGVKEQNLLAGDLKFEYLDSMGTTQKDKTVRDLVSLIDKEMADSNTSNLANIAGYLNDNPTKVDGFSKIFNITKDAAGKVITGVSFKTDINEESFKAIESPSLRDQLLGMWAQSKYSSAIFFNNGAFSIKQEYLDDRTKLLNLSKGSNILSQLVMKIVKPPEKYRTIQDRAMYVLEKLWVKFGDASKVLKTNDPDGMSEDAISLALKRLKDESKAPDGKPLFSQTEIDLLSTLIFASRQEAIKSLSVQRAMRGFETAVCGSDQYKVLLGKLYANDTFYRGKLGYDLGNLGQILAGMQSETDKVRLINTLNYSLSIMERMIADYQSLLASDEDKKILVRMREQFSELLTKVNADSFKNPITGKIDGRKLGIELLDIQIVMNRMSLNLPDIKFKTDESAIRKHWELTEANRDACLAASVADREPDSLFWFEPKMSPQEMIKALTPGTEQTQLKESVDNQARDFAKKFAISEADAKLMVDNKDDEAYYTTADSETYLATSTQVSGEGLRGILDRISRHSKVLGYGVDSSGSAVGLTCIDQANSRLAEVLTSLQKELNNDTTYKDNPGNTYRDKIRNDFRSKLISGLFLEKQWAIMIAAMKDKGFLKTDVESLKQYFVGKDPKPLNDAITSVLDSIVNNLDNLKFDEDGVPVIDWKVLTDAMLKDMPLDPNSAASIKSGLGAFLSSVFNFALNSKAVTKFRLDYEQARLGATEPANSGPSWKQWIAAKSQKFTKDGNDYGTDISECMQNLLTLRWADMLDRATK